MAFKYLGDGTLKGNLSIDSNKPLDTRAVVDSLTDLYGIDNTTAYTGMPVVVVGESAMYILTDISNISNASGWEKVGAESSQQSFFTGEWVSGIHYKNGHVVAHDNCLWLCVSANGTDEKPAWNSTAWHIVSGDSNVYVEIEGDSVVLASHPDQTLRLTLRLSTKDITDEVVADSRTKLEWTRSTGIASEDQSWTPTYIDGHGKNEVALTIGDFGSGWGVSYRKVTFSCTIEMQLNGSTSTATATASVSV